jgi:hypothetical protein
VQLLATGERHRLNKGDALLFSRVAGALANLRLGPDGIGLTFRGRAAHLARRTAGLAPVRLLPSVLDLWVPAAYQVALLRAAGILALLVLLSVVAGLGVRRPAARPAPAIPE